MSDETSILQANRVVHSVDTHIIRSNTLNANLTSMASAFDVYVIHLHSAVLITVSTLCHTSYFQLRVLLEHFKLKWVETSIVLNSHTWLVLIPDFEESILLKQCIFEELMQGNKAFIVLHQNVIHISRFNLRLTTVIWPNWVKRHHFIVLSKCLHNFRHNPLNGISNISRHYRRASFNNTAFITKVSSQSFLATCLNGIIL